jgi:hypothetical protein
VERDFSLSFFKLIDLAKQGSFFANKIKQKTKLNKAWKNRNISIDLEEERCKREHLSCKH